MRIAIDATPLETGHKKRGIGIYTRKLIENLKATDRTNEYILFTRGQELPKVDLVHYPYFDLFFLTLPLKKPYKTVVTIHDLIPLVFPQFYPLGLRGKIKFQIQKFSVKPVSAIITDSENSKKDVVRFLKFPEDKVHVVYLAADEIFKPAKDKDFLEKVRRKYNLPEKFILYVGDVNLHKNLKKLLAAIAKVNWPLVAVGEALTNENLIETKELLSEIKKLQIEKKVLRLGFVKEEDLVGIYNLATLLVKPSLYEGFGLPVLEAMSCGLPVASSNASSLPEVGGNAPVYFDPNSESEMTSAIETIIKFYEKDRAKYDELKMKGIAQAKKFFWEKTARETIKIYEFVAHGS